MKVIRPVDTYSHHCRLYYNIQIEAPRAKARKARPFDSTNWKNNDLYAMLGLEDKRQDATFEDIRNAYRQAVLVHHPDKQTQRAAYNPEDDSRFKVLQKAFTWLSDPDRRQQYDSIDFDESIPRVKEYSEEEFWALFPECFWRNSRFSTKQPVPFLSRQMTRDQVDSFYTFWFNFESWRRFEFLDEEEVESGERAEKRWIEKKNKAARQKRKTEDNARISKLVELAYKNDPRIKAWKEEEKRAKEAKKQQQSVKKPSPATTTTTTTPPPRSSPSPTPSQDQERKKREEQLKAAMAAASEAKTHKKAIRAIFNENNFFSSGNVKEMERVSLLMEQALLKLGNLEIKEFYECVKGDCERAVEQLEAVLSSSSSVGTTSTTSTTSTTQPTTTPTTTAHSWSAEQIDLLIKAVKMFPPGVADRWTRISTHLNKSFPVSHDDVLKKAEDVKNGKLDPDDLVVPAVPVPKKRDPRVDQAEPTILIREDIPNAAIAPATAPWTPEEQHLLEKAMKQVGSDVEDRWGKIAEMLPGRSRQDVVKRVKEIAERVKQQQKK